MNKEDAYRFAKTVKEIEDNGYTFDEALDIAWRTVNARSSGYLLTKKLDKYP